MKLDNLTRKSRDQIGTGLAVVAGAGFLTAGYSNAQSGGVVLPGATANVLPTGNAIVTYNGTQFALPAGQFTQSGGQLVVSTAVARVFAPEALATQPIAQTQVVTQPIPTPIQQNQVLIEPLKSETTQNTTLSTLQARAPEPVNQALLQQAYAPPQASPQPLGLGTIDAVAPQTSLIPSFGSAGGLLEGNSILMLGGIAVAAGIAYFALTGLDEDDSSTSDTTTSEPATDTTPPVMGFTINDNTDIANGTAGTQIADFNAIDAGGPDAGITYSFAAAKTGFAIDAKTGVITTTSALSTQDADNDVTLTIVAKDAAGNQSTRDLTVSLRDTVDPVFASLPTFANVDLRSSDTQTLGTIAANDETSTTTYAILDGSTAITSPNSHEGFVVDPTNGVITFDSDNPGAVDSAGTHTLTIQATDESGNTVTTPVNIVIGDPGDVTGPVITGDTNATITEGYSTGVEVVDLAATDAGVGLPDDGNVFSIQTDSSGGGFEIDEQTGLITIADPDRLDVDGAGTRDFTVVVEAIDDNDNVSTHTVTVTVEEATIKGDAINTIDLEALYDGYIASDPNLADDANWFVFSQDKGVAGSSGLDGSNASDDLFVHINTDGNATDTMITLAYDSVATFGETSSRILAHQWDVGSTDYGDEAVYMTSTLQDDTTPSTYTAAVLTDDSVMDADLAWTEDAQNTAATTAFEQSTTIDSDTAADGFDIDDATDDLVITFSSPLVVPAVTATISTFTADSRYIEVGDADGDGDMNELFILDDDGVLTTYSVDLSGTLRPASTAWDGVDLDDLSDGTVDGVGSSATALSFLWMEGATTAATDDQILIVSSDGNAYIYGSDIV